MQNEECILCNIYHVPCTILIFTRPSLPSRHLPSVMGKGHPADSPPIWGRVGERVFNLPNIFCVTYHNVVGVGVVADAVPFGLHQLGGVAYAEAFVSAQRNVEGEEMAHGGCVDKVGKDHVVVVVFQREDFVVGLTVHGREGNADEGDGEAVGGFPPLSFDGEVVGGFAGEVNHQVESALCGVVAVSVVVDAASVGRCGKSCGEVPAAYVAEVVEPGSGEAYAASVAFHVLGGVFDVVGIDFCLCVEADVAVPEFGAAFCLVNEAGFDAFVGVGGQVGIENVGGAEAEEEGMVPT